MPDAQLFFFETCEIFKKIFLIEHLRWLLLFQYYGALILFWTMIAMSFLLIDFKRSKCEHSHKKRNDSLETRTEPAVLRTYVDNQAGTI